MSKKQQAKDIVSHFKSLKRKRTCVVKSKQKISVKKLKQENPVLLSFGKYKISKHLKMQKFQVCGKKFVAKPKNLTYSTEINKHVINCACWGYLAFFIPLIFCKQNFFARYHADQSLKIFLMFIVYSAILVGIYFLSKSAFIVLCPIAVLVICLMIASGIYDVKTKQTRKVLFKIIKY